MYDKKTLPTIYPNVYITVPPFYEWKYKVGEVFEDLTSNDILEITGYNLRGTYKAEVTMNIGGGNAVQYHAHVVLEEKLDKMRRYDSMSHYLRSKKKDAGIKYRIHYHDTNKKDSVTEYYDIELSNVRALAKLLNSIVKINPARRIVLVTIIDSSGKYVSHVKFLRKEIEQQKFLTGMKERLLAHAKYECGYEVATGF